ncbi:MAG: histidine kinase dimerization/phospho-acceptor domain-containing protein, partial [Myxococcota bacterium]
GATAHELNQPLTSMLGYVELLRGNELGGARLARALETIRGDAERMAEIVRKLSKVTALHSMPYVGDTRIMDLTQSSEFELDAASRAPEDTQSHE